MECHCIDTVERESFRVEIKRDGSPHKMPSCLCAAFCCSSYLWPSWAECWGGGGRQGWSCSSVQTRDTRLPSPLMTHCICLQRLASSFTSSSSRGILNPDKMLDVFVRVFEKYKARCRVLELRRAAVARRRPADVTSTGPVHNWFVSWANHRPALHVTTNGRAGRWCQAY